MGGHDVMKAYAIVREQEIERERGIRRQNQLREAQASDPARIGRVTWFQGMKATARFLADSAQVAIEQRRMTAARS